MRARVDCSERQPAERHRAKARGPALPVCAFCAGARLQPVVDFGDVALAGAFLQPEQFAAESTFPLRLYFCEDCFAVQVADKIPADTLFRKYFYFSSSIATLRDHFQRYAAEVSARFLTPSRASVLEFGCNDGVLLRPLADQGIKTVIGVDPAANVLATIGDPRITAINGYFSEDIARRVVAEHGAMDLIIANNVYAHIADICGVTRAVATALKPDGVFIFEVHYLGKIIDELQYDMIYHEHLYYYSLLALANHLARHGMMVFDIKPIPIHAGSIRFYACRTASKYSGAVSPAVKALVADERAKGFDRYDTFRRFSGAVAQHRAELLELLTELRSRGCRIAGYGASGRANTMIQYCGIDERHLDYMIDDAPAKIGLYTPKSHFKIHSSSILAGDNPPDYLLIFAWSFLDEIRAKNRNYLAHGGRMIIPLPKVSIFPPLAASS